MMRAIHVTLALMLTVAAAAAVSAQPASSPRTPLDNQRHAVAGELCCATIDDDTLINRGIDYVAVLTHTKATRDFIDLLVKFEEERSDKQVGTAASSSGSTTVASKGTVPKILGFAVENGAITQSRSGTTVTFRGNVGGAIAALAGNGLLEIAAPNDPSIRALRRSTFSGSFDTSRGATGTNSEFTGDQQQLSQLTARIELVNHRDPDAARAIMKWRTRLTDPQTQITVSARILADALKRDPAVAAWLADTTLKTKAAQAAARGKTDDAASEDIEVALKAQEASFPVRQLAPETIRAVDTWANAALTFSVARQALLDEVASGALVTFEYTNDRPLKAPKTSNVRLIGEIGGAVDITGNASLTLFDGDAPPGATGRIRDFQLTGELDFKIGSSESVGAFTLALAGKYMRQLQNSYNDAGTMVPNTTGTIAVGQIKLIIPTKGTGVKIPLSLTFANRTEVIRESIVRANVGITYDLDTIFAHFKP